MNKYQSLRGMGFRFQSMMLFTVEAPWTSFWSIIGMVLISEL